MKKDLRFDLDETEKKILCEHAINFAVILDRLTLKMEESASLLYVAVDAMLNLRRRREVEIMFEKRYSGDKDHLPFALVKHYSVIRGLKFAAIGIAENTLAKKNTKYLLVVLNIPSKGRHCQWTRE